MAAASGSPSSAMRYEEPRRYRSRRLSLQRLVIPGALAALIAAGAIGAAASYLVSRPTSVGYARGRDRQGK